MILSYIYQKICSFCIWDTNMAFKHISLLWSAKGVKMSYVGDTAFLPVPKKKTKQKKTGHVGDTAFLQGQNPISPHSEHLAVLPLSPHSISNRQTCQKEENV